MAKKVASNVILECKFLNARYPKVKDPRGKKAYLTFRGGRAVVSQQFFEEIQSQPQYGSEFARLGELSRAAIPQSAVVVVGGPISTATAAMASARPSISEISEEGEIRNADQ